MNLGCSGCKRNGKQFTWCQRLPLHDGSCFECNLSNCWGCKVLASASRACFVPLIMLWSCWLLPLWPLVHVMIPVCEFLCWRYVSVISKLVCEDQRTTSRHMSIRDWTVLKFWWLLYTQQWTQFGKESITYTSDNHNLNKGDPILRWCIFMDLLIQYSSYIVNLSGDHDKQNESHPHASWFFDVGLTSCTWSGSGCIVKYAFYLCNRKGRLVKNQNF